MRSQGMPRRFGHGQLQGQQREGGGIVERGRDVADGNAVEAHLHVLDRVHRRPAGAEHLRRHLVGVVAAVDRVAGDERDGAAAVRQDRLEPLVVVLRHAEPDQLALRPGAAAVHAWRRCRASSAAGPGSPAPPCSAHRPRRRASPRACRAAASRCRSGCSGSACRPGPPARRIATGRAPARTRRAAAARPLRHQTLPASACDFSQSRTVPRQDRIRAAKASYARQRPLRLDTCRRIEDFE